MRSDAVGRRAGWLFALGVVVFALIVFRVVLLPGSILFTTDDNVGALALRKAALPAGFLGWWDDSVLAGVEQTVFVNWTNVLLWLLPAGFFTTWIHAIDLALASVFLALFLRSRRHGWIACSVGALASFWVGSNFTLTYAGHIGKYGVMMFAAAALWLIEMAVQRRSIAWGVLAGGALGSMFLEQADVALFFSMFLFPYAAYAVFRSRRGDVAAWFLVLAPLVLISAVIALRPLLSGYQAAVKGIVSMKEDDPGAKWEFATQWSWPPEECIDFIAPGYTGWRSGEPTGPYWGRMGRSAGWEKTQQGFQNFKLENQYLGAIPVVFALWAVFAAWCSRKSGKAGFGDVFFWATAAVVSLLLAFGKHFLLYRLFYLLPVVSSIRNPNKFLHIFQLAVGILAAYGFTSAIGGAAERPRASAFIKGVFAAFGIVALWAFGAFASWGSAVTRVAADGWGVVADVIVGNQAWALAQGAAMLLAAAVLLWLLMRKPPRGTAAALAARWAIVILMALDALSLARHYIQPMPRTLIAENDVVRFLKQRLGTQRTALVSQENFYNAWLTYLFPYHGLKTVNVTQMPRMPEDYQAFLGAVRPQPLRFWPLMAVGYVLGPSQLWTQIQQDPNVKGLFDIVYAYNVVPEPDGNTKVVPATEARPGAHVILRVNTEAPRFLMADSWRVVPDDEALRALVATNFVLFSTTLVAPGTAESLPASRGEGAVGNVGVKQYRPGRVRLQVSTERPAILRVSERYDPDWRVWVDGRPAPLLRCDYLFQGALIEPGLHEVVFEYRPERTTLWIQAAGSALCLAAIAWLILTRRPVAA